jgi:hypothetical protein
VRKYPLPLKRKPNEDAITARRTTGAWCSSARVETLPPQCRAVAIERNGEARRLGDIVRIDMQFDFDAVRKVSGRLVDHHVPARHQKEPPLALEEKTARIRQQPLRIKGEHGHRSE